MPVLRSGTLNMHRAPDMFVDGTSCWAAGVALLALEHQTDPTQGPLTESQQGYLSFGGHGTVIAHKEIHRRLENFPECGPPYKAYIHLLEQALTNIASLSKQDVDSAAYQCIKAWFEAHNAKAFKAEEACKDLLDTPANSKKKKGKKKRDSRDECIICMTEPRSHIYRPCGHRICCGPCAEEFWQKCKTCPWCRCPCDDPC